MSRKRISNHARWTVVYYYIHDPEGETRTEEYMTRGQYERAVEEEKKHGWRVRRVNHTWK